MSTPGEVNAASGQEFQTPIGVCHVRRESATRKGAYRLLCHASLRDVWGHVGEADIAEADCPRCLAVLEREAKAAV